MFMLTGVLWTGLDTVVPGAQEVVKFLRQKVLLSVDSITPIFSLKDKIT